VRVLVLAEYYPRAGDPARGVWAHRQALAARDAGAEVRVLVLHRPLPPLGALRRLDVRTATRELAQSGTAVLDGLPVDYVRYLSPPRPWSYATWGAWAAPWLARRLRALRERFPFDLVHAHYAVPAGDALRRADPSAPLVLSIHGHDVYGAGAGANAVRATLPHARLVLANSRGTAERCTAAGARVVRVVHLGTDVPPAPRPEPDRPTLVTVAHLVARKRHADVIAVLPRLAERHPGLRYVIVGDGPERAALAARANALGVAERVEFRGALAPADAVQAARAATLFVLPSVDEAFGVAFVEAMAAGVPAIGCAGEPGPEEIAACGGGIALVPPRDPAALGDRLGALLADSSERAALGARARATASAAFTWERCGNETLEAYRTAIGGTR
jgi:glycosyltransferase involved in cell wall biosynthesis